MDKRHLATCSLILTLSVAWLSPAGAQRSYDELCHARDVMATKRQQLEQARDELQRQIDVLRQRTQALRQRRDKVLSQLDTINASLQETDEALQAMH